MATALKRKSGIKQKTGECIDCSGGKKVPLIAGRCHYHYWKHRNQVSQEKGRNTERYAAKTKPPNRKTCETPDVSKSDLINWYKNHMATAAPVCENCGKAINKQNTFEWHGSQAHILPKSLFPSIATHPDNHGVLGLYCCHGQFDANWTKARAMPFFKTALHRFEKFYKNIAEGEQRKIPQTFLLTVKL